MSSATVLFVIKHILDLPPADDGGDSTGDRAGAPGSERICSMAFGPGLTVETALFTRLRAPKPAVAEEAGTAAAESAQPVPVRA
jgi:predicted naringenin-chalcone synthase